MNDIVFLIIFIALLCYIAYLEYRQHKERRDFIKALMARNVTELSQAELTEKIEPTHEEEQSEYVSVDQADDQLFQRALDKVLGKAK